MPLPKAKNWMSALSAHKREYITLIPKNFGQFNFRTENFGPKFKDFGQFRTKISDKFYKTTRNIGQHHKLNFIVFQTK